MKISCAETATGLDLHIDSRSFPLRFPVDIWQSYPDRKLFADNYAFLKALHLPQLLDLRVPLEFETSAPLLRQSIQSVILHNIPFCADADRCPTADNIRRFLALDPQFADYTIRRPRGGASFTGKAVLNMSFGKDSLLTWAVAREIGLPTLLVMSVTNDCPREFAYKREIAQRFSDEFKEEIQIVESDAGVIHLHGFWGVAPTEWGIGHLMTEYTFHTVPFAYRHGAEYILLGNERGCNDSYIGCEGYRCYPVYDQSIEWMLELTNMVRAMTGGPMTVMSLIEPLYDVAITRILHTRYPEVGKYQMSCFPDENDHGKDNAWCGHCSKCARSFAFLTANGIDPRSVGLDTDMFGEGFEDLFSVFGSRRTDIKTLGFDASPCGRDEQLHALHQAMKRGASGAVIERFKRERLADVEQRSTELSARFLEVHDSRAMPADIARKVRAIYAETLRA